MAVLPALALGATAVSGVLGAASAAQQAKAQKDQALYRAAVARNQAQFEMARGSVEESRQKARVSHAVSTQRAAQSTSGFDVNSGTAARLRASTQVVGDWDAETLRENARARANAALDQTSLYQIEAQNAQAAAPLMIGSSLLGAASSIGDKWSAFKNVGLF